MAPTTIPSYTVRMFAAYAKADRATLADALRTVEPVRVTARSRYYALPDLLAAHAGMIERKFRSQRQPRGGKAKDRLEEAKADLAELELATKRGELVEVEAVLEMDAARLTRARQVLEAFPGRLAPAFVGETDRLKIEERLRDEALSIAAALEKGLMPS